ncbi:MAG: CDP-alcohol phosphatidyltransferase family protein [Clostridia bacterium]|nr:CDP-alcohol phosphatidyltransferase family protein [Clostridia bacterium]
METTVKNKYETKYGEVFTIPNILSMVRICLIPIIVWLYCGVKDYTLTGIILILSGITDLVDGFIARRFNMVSDLGKILDPIADKLTQSTMLICLFFRFPLMLLPFFLIFAKEVFMSITGALVIKKTGEVNSADWHGKVATCMLYAMMILHVFWFDIPSDISAISIIACFVMIGISFLLYGIKNIKKIKAYNK